jgi:hypothetical protein
MIKMQKFLSNKIATKKGKKPSNYCGSNPSSVKKNFAEKAEAIFNTVYNILVFLCR